MLTVPPCDELLIADIAADLGIDPTQLARGPVSGLLERDVTSWSIIAADAVFAGGIVSRSAGVICGLAVARRAFELVADGAGMAGAVTFTQTCDDGTAVHPGMTVATVTGPARVVLAAERTALDMLMVLSGIASEAARWQAAAGPVLQVLDTRKTLPGLRALSKYAVACGGAHNHRAGLWDMVLVKDNHIRAAGGIDAAVHAARAVHPELVVEVEADTIAQALQAAVAGADVVLLDNMDDDLLRQAVTAVRSAAQKTGARCLTEASGNITYARLARLAATGVDRVSASAITLARGLDLGLDELAASSVRPDVVR